MRWKALSTISTSMVRKLCAARFSAPMELGGLPTADPLDPRPHDPRRRAQALAGVREVAFFPPMTGG